MLYENLSTNSLGHLCFAGRDTVELAEKYGTPLMLMDETEIRNSCRIYIDSMREFMGEKSRPLFASKACCFKELYRIIADEGMCTDIVSPGELYTAASVDFPMKDAFFHGNNKTNDDIAFALDCGIGYFIVDNYEELDAINTQAAKLCKAQKILLRLTPGIDPHTQEKINTGKVDSKFGTAIETGQAKELCQYALNLDSVELCGFHCHIGSQIFEYEPYSRAAEIMLKFCKELKDDFNYEAQMLNLGGGFGVRYVPDDPEINYRENIKELSREIKICCQELDIKQPDILMEPGRSIVASAGLTMYTVGAVKTIKGYKSYVSIDGGMTDNPRFALYGSAYSVFNADYAEAVANFEADITGRCCESGDIIQENVKLFRPKRGEHIAVAVTGAYNYSMSSNYNRIGRPAIVMIGNDGSDRLVVRRETYADMCEREI